MTPPGYSPPPAQPQGLGGIMRTAITMYRAAPLPFVLVALVSTLPSGLLLAGSQIAYGTPTSHVRAVLQEGISVLPELLLGQLSIAATTILVMQMLNGQAAHSGSALELVGERFWHLAAVVVVTWAAIIVGLFAFVIPGLYLLVVWMFAPICSVTEDRSPRDAIGQSAGLVKGAFWWVLGSYLAIQITVALGALVVTDLISIPLSPVGGTVGIIARSFVAFVALTAFIPVANAGVALIYMERRVRAHGTWPLPIPAQARREH